MQRHANERCGNGTDGGCLHKIVERKGEAVQNPVIPLCSPVHAKLSRTPFPCSWNCNSISIKSPRPKTYPPPYPETHLSSPHPSPKHGYVCRKVTAVGDGTDWGSDTVSQLTLFTSDPKTKTPIRKDRCVELGSLPCLLRSSRFEGCARVVYGWGRPTRRVQWRGDLGSWG